MIDLALLRLELRRAAARPMTVALRVLFGLALLIGFASSYQGLAPRPGVGRALIFELGGLLLAGVYVVQPLMMARAIADARRQGILDLLRTSELSPWGILLQTYAGRLVAMLTLLLTALPLAAVAYALGGVGRVELVGLSSLLLVATVHAGAFGLLGALRQRGTLGAVALAWTAGFAAWFVVWLVGRMATWILDLPLSGLGDLTAPIGTLGWLARSPAPEQLGPQLLGMLAATAIGLGLARLTWARGGAGLSTLDTRPKGIHEAPLPDDQPVVWRMRHRSTLYRQVDVLMLPMLPLGMLTLMGAMSVIAQPGATLALVLLGACLSAAAAAVPVPLERADDTLELLLTTPMPGWMLTDQWLTGAHRIRHKLWWLLGLLLYGSVAGGMEQVHPVAGLLGGAMALVACLALLQVAPWVGMACGLTLRRVALSLPAAVGLCLAVALTPLLLDQALDGRSSWIERLSPGWSLVQLERDRWAGSLAILLHVLVVTLAAEGLCRAIRSRADRWLGRPVPEDD